MPLPVNEGGGPFGERPGGNGELAYQSRYFAAWFADDGSLSRISLEFLASLTEEEAGALEKLRAFPAAASAVLSGRKREESAAVSPKALDPGWIWFIISTKDKSL